MISLVRIKKSSIKQILKTQLNTIQLHIFLKLELLKALENKLLRLHIIMWGRYPLNIYLHSLS